MSKNNYNELFSYEDLFNKAMDSSDTVSQILADAMVLDDREERLESIALADLILKGAQVFATLALAKSVNDNKPARPGLRAL